LSAYREPARAVKAWEVKIEPFPDQPGAYAPLTNLPDHYISEPELTPFDIVYYWLRARLGLAGVYLLAGLLMAAETGYAFFYFRRKYREISRN
jgi:hypothetical protein